MNKSLKLLFLFCIFCLSIPLVNANISDDMISYWTLDDSETSSGITSDVIGDNNGTVFNVTTGVEGKVGQAYDFDGYNDYIEVSDDSSLDITNGMTVSYWIRYEGINTQYNWQGVVAKGDWNNQGWHAYHDKDEFYMQIDGSNEPTNYAISDALGKWKHFVWIYSNNTLSVYINDTLVNQHNANDLSTTNNPLYIGRLGTGNEWFNGTIDEVAIWNRSLSESEVEKIYSRSYKGNSYIDSINNTNTSSPSSSNFSAEYGSTNFSKISDLTSVSNMTLAVSNSKVNWKNSINAKGENYDKNVKLSQGLVSVNSSALDSSINSSATVSLDINSCSDFDIYKSNKPVSSLSELKSQGSVVGDESGCTSSYCGNVSC